MILEEELNDISMWIVIFEHSRIVKDKRYFGNILINKVPSMVNI